MIRAIQRHEIYLYQGCPKIRSESGVIHVLDMSKTPLTPTRRRPVDEYPADRQNSPIVNGELDGSFLLRLVLCEAWFGGGVFVDFSGGPGGEQGEGVGGRRGWLRGVDGEGESRFGAQVEAFVGEFEVADDVVVEVLDPGAVGANNRSASPTASSDPGWSRCRTSSRADSAPARTSCSCAPSWLGASDRGVRSAASAAPAPSLIVASSSRSPTSTESVRNRSAWPGSCRFSPTRHSHPRRVPSGQHHRFGPRRRPRTHHTAAARSQRPPTLTPPRREADLGCCCSRPVSAGPLPGPLLCRSRQAAPDSSRSVTVSSSAAARLDQQPYRFAGAAVEHAGPRDSHEAVGGLSLSLLRVRVLRRPDG